MTTRFKRPMKADTLAETIEDLDKVEINYPVIASPKIDGIRCLKDDGKVLSSTLKLIPNKYTRSVLERLLPDGADGELTPRGGDENFQDCTSMFMSVDGEPEFTFWMFDYVATQDALTLPYEDRLQSLFKWWRLSGDAVRQFVRVVPTVIILDREELDAFMKASLEEGFKEGVMIRKPSGPYKCGRATLREGWLSKIKYRADSEAKIVGFTEQMHNANVAKKDERGLTKRSSAKAGKVPAGTLGTLKVRDVHTDIEFEIGTGKGLTAELRLKIWNNRKIYLGKFIKYSYQPCGVKDKPRQPSFLGMRDKRDMG